MEQESLVFEDENGPEYSGEGKQKKIKGKAPIVVFGGKKCIWLNKEECENGKDKTMKLWTLELVARAVPFDREGEHNDFAKAEELIKQCEDELTEGCTKEELDMLVTVCMSKEDNYNKVEPILEKENTVEGLFEDLYQGKIDEEGLRKGLKQIVSAERNKPDATEETAKVLSDKIAEQSKLLTERLEERERLLKEETEKKEKIDKAFGKLDSEIDGLHFGGK